MENAYMASSEVLKAWGAGIEESEEGRLYNQYFEPTWRSFASKLDLVIAEGNSVNFMRAYLTAASE